MRCLLTSCSEYVHVFRSISRGIDNIFIEYPIKLVTIEMNECTPLFPLQLDYVIKACHEKLYIVFDH